MKKFFPLLILALTSCVKEGPGGQVTLVAFPKHHSKPIPNAMVYIKYGTNDFPGTTTSAYDDSGVAVIEGTLDPHYHFENLKKGKYYLYSVGYDSAIAQTVTGGIPVKINVKAGEVDVVVPVTE